MNVLLVEPLGHIEGHFPTHTKYLSQALADAGADVTLLTFDGLLGNSTELDDKVTHISFISKNGALGRLVRFLPRLFPSKFVQRRLDTFFSTVCTFSEAHRQSRKGKYQVVHILDACMRDYAFPWFASAVSRCSLVFNLFSGPREAYLENWRARFRHDLSKGQIMMAFQLWLSRLLETRPATALRRFLYQRAAKRNRLAFICYTKAVRDSYSGSPFYDKIVLMFRGMAVPEGHTLAKVEARQHLNLPQNKVLLLHFGTIHHLKNIEVIFQAVQGLPGGNKLLFAGKVPPVIWNSDPRKLAQEYGVWQNTIIVDKYIPDDEVSFFFYAADAVILSHRKHFKGNSGVLATAAQFTLPVIISDIGEEGEAVKNYGLGLTFKPENTQSLREAILCFLSIKDEGKQAMKTNLSHFAKTHSWQEAAQRHVELYQDLIKAQPKVKPQPRA